MSNVLYHIDHGISEFEKLEKKAPYGYFWCINYARPPISYMLKDEDFNRVWFKDKGKCLDARVNRARRELDLEIEFRDKELAT